MILFRYVFCYFRSHHSHLSLATSVGNRSNTSMWRERLDISIQWHFFRALLFFHVSFWSGFFLYPFVSSTSLICLTFHYLILYFNDNSRVYQVNPACKKHRVFANLGPSRWQFVSLCHIKCILCKKIWFVSCLVGFISCSVRVIYKIGTSFISWL